MVDRWIQSIGVRYFNEFSSGALAFPPEPPTKVSAISDGSGIIDESSVTDVIVNCVTETYTIGGNVSGLSSSGLVLNQVRCNNISKWCCRTNGN